MLMYSTLPYRHLFGVELHKAVYKTILAAFEEQHHNPELTIPIHTVMC
jgi:hypothetical protein